MDQRLFCGHLGLRAFRFLRAKFKRAETSSVSQKTRSPLKRESSLRPKFTTSWHRTHREFRSESTNGNEKASHRKGALRCDPSIPPRGVLGPFGPKVGNGVENEFPGPSGPGAQKVENRVEKESKKLKKS